MEQSYDLASRSTRTEFTDPDDDRRKLALIEFPNGELHLSISTQSKQVGFRLLTPEARDEVAHLIGGTP